MVKAYVSLPEFKAYLGNFVDNDPNEPECSDTQLEKLLESHALKIKANLSRLYTGINFPSPNGTVVEPEWIDLFLEDLNIDYPVSSILSVQAIKKFNLSVKQSAIYQNLGNYKFKRLLAESYTPAILGWHDGYIFDTTSFIDETDVQLTSLTPGLTITENSIPNLDQAKRLCLRASALIRAVAFTNGFDTVITNLNDDQLGLYRDITVSLVAPQIARIALSYHPQAQITDLVESSILDTNPSAIYSGFKMLETLEIGQEYFDLLPYIA